MDRSGLALCVDLLGPLQLRVEGRAVAVPGARRRALLALLALEGDRGIGTERLVDSLWPDDPPTNAVPALHNHVSRLRGNLGALAERLERHATGYRLHLEPFELDVDAARRLAVHDPGAALGLWRGPALEEFRSLPALEVESVALDELRLQLVDDLLESRLSRGDRTVTVDAAAAATASPLRERTALLHVRALASDGRTAEAMEAAQAFRRRLVDETGLDPTPALAELEQRVAAGSIERSRAMAHVARPDGPMVGRQHDREEVMRLLGSHAVVTLTGPGGVGKTRLALDIASDVAFRDAVVVPLARVDSSDRVCQAAASTLGLRTNGDAKPVEVATALTDRELLLVLDNCEHLVDACRELVVALRGTAPGVRVLATSRVTLQVPGEYVVRLQPLPVPRDASNFDTLRRQSSVRAFVEHARRRSPGYELAPDAAPDLVEVLGRLDGLPLGIELAARQVGVMPLSAVRARLDRALDLATGPRGPEDRRQHTLRVSIASSYDLLGEAEQDLLRAIASFPGGVDLATVEALASGGADPLDLLHGLVDASLVVADAASGRYRLLFTVRAFLIDLLVALGEQEEAHRLFVERCVTVAEEIRASMYGPDEAATDRRLRAELDNFRAARDLADLDARVRITVALNQVATWRDLREPWTWALELVPVAVDHPDRATILACAADAARMLGDLDEAGRLADEALAAGGEGLDRVWSCRGAVAHFRGDFAGAREGWLRVQGPGEAAAFIASAALASAYGGELELARELLESARARATCGSHHAFLAYVEGELLAVSATEESIPHYLEAIEIASRVGCNFVEGVARVSLASARSRTGDVAGAAEGFAYLIDFWRRTGQTTQLWTTARNAAQLLASVGRAEAAAALLICADTARGAAAVGPEIARYSGRAFTPVAELVDAKALDALRERVSRTGGSVVLDQAAEELRELSAGHR